MQPPEKDHAPRTVDADEAAYRLEAGALALDVREDDEWGAGHLAGSRHLRLDDLDPDALPRDRPIVAVCRSGRRSGDAAERLQASGLDAVNLEGGLQAWRESGRELVTDAGERGTVA
jgi:rhodanese-related sulfurtransferase